LRGTDRLGACLARQALRKSIRTPAQEKLEMRWLGITVGLFAFVAVQAAAEESHFERSLKKLEPTERLEQICDYTAMKKINAAPNGMRPDRAVGDARSRIIVTKDRIEAKGGAFRSHHKWYELSYTCTASTDHMKVLKFEYKIGPAIPEDKWASYNLWK
jgi:hypothetical protein